jgi:hypothetical protein
MNFLQSVKTTWPTRGIVMSGRHYCHLIRVVKCCAVIDLRYTSTCAAFVEVMFFFFRMRGDNVAAV